MVGLVDQYSQLYPPKPSFTEKDLPSLRGKVYIITGANTGLGKELAQILYAKDAKVYIAARSEEKGLKAIEDIKAAAPNSSGDLVFMRLDLADLTTIKASAQQFLDRETKLHVLFNNAGVMLPPEDQKTAQGYDLQLGVNNIGTQMFTDLLTPTLVATARTEPTAAIVRVVWVGSSAGESPAAPKGGVPMENDLEYQHKAGNFTRYAVSKAGNYLQAAEFARRHRADGVVSIALNPGNLNSDLWRTQGRVASWFLQKFVLHPPIYGAYTELFAGLSPEVTIEKTGEWVAPFGRFMKNRKDLKEASKTKAEGGTGGAHDFWEWVEVQIRQYL